MMRGPSAADADAALLEFGFARRARIKSTRLSGGRTSDDEDDEDDEEDDADEDSVDFNSIGRAPSATRRRLVSLGRSSGADRSIGARCLNNCW